MYKPLSDERKEDITADAHNFLTIGLPEIVADTMRAFNHACAKSGVSPSESECDQFHSWVERVEDDLYEEIREARDVFASVGWVAPYTDYSKVAPEGWETYWRAWTRRPAVTGVHV